MKGVMEKHTINWLRRKSEANALDFTISIQRKEVWDKEHKSNLIASILLGIPIESLLFEEDETGEEYLVLDGKQRCLTFLQFMRDEFEISEKCKVHKINGETIVGKKYSDLSEKLKEDIREYELPITVMRPLTDEERELIFFMRNQAISLTKVELMRVLMGSKTLDSLKVLFEHPIIEKLCLKTAKGYRNQQVVTEILILETGKDYSFSGRDLMAFAEELKETGLDDATQKIVLDIFDYLDTAIEKKRRIRKVHIPMLYKVARQAMNDAISPDIFYIWMNKFFEDVKGDENEYNKACESGMLKKSNIKTRIEFMTKHYMDNIDKLNVQKVVAGSEK